MDEARHRATVTDEALDRAIGELLDVEPAADFVARARARIESEPMWPGWFGSRWIEIAIAAACLFVMLVTWSNWPQRTAVPEPSISQRAANLLRPSVEPNVPAPVAATPGVASSSAAVLVSPAEAAGLRDLMSALREGSFDPGLLPAAGDDMEPPMPLVIEPITVEPLASAADIEAGVLQ